MVFTVWTTLDNQMNVITRIFDVMKYYFLRFEPLNADSNENVARVDMNVRVHKGAGCSRIQPHGYARIGRTANPCE